MHSRNYLRVIAASLAAFVASLAWYTVFGGVMVELSGPDPSNAANTTPLWAMLFVVAQSLVVASVLAYLVSRLGIVNRRAALRLGVLVWIFPASILLGSVVHENVPPALAASMRATGSRNYSSCPSYLERGVKVPAPMGQTVELHQESCGAGRSR